MGTNIMPTIRRKEIKPKKVKYKNQTTEFYTDKYNSVAWKNLRKVYYSLHPICEECLKRNVITPAEEVHHRRAWSTGESEEEQWKLFLDESNLISVCRPCHLGYHRKMDRYNLNTCDELTDKEWKETHHIEDYE